MLLEIAFGTTLVLIVLFLVPLALDMAGAVFGVIILVTITLFVIEVFEELGLSITTLPSWFVVSLFVVLGCSALYAFWDYRRRLKSASVRWRMPSGPKRTSA